MTKQYYLILGAPRSGTTALHLLIAGHPNVSTLNDEVKLDQILKVGISAFTYGGNTKKENDKSPWETFKFLSEYNSNNLSMTFGMKAATGNLAILEDYSSIIRNKLRHVSIIGCVRSDIMAQYASLKRAQFTGQWHSWRKEIAVASNFRLRIDPAEYSQYYLKNIQIIAQIRKLKESNNYLEISYEEDILKGVDYALKVFDYLNLPYVEPNWFNSKKVAPPVEDYVVNHDDIRKVEKKVQDSMTPIKPSLLKRISKKICSIEILGR